MIPTPSDKVARSRAFDLSWLRCPRSTCPDYGRRLVIEVGQHSTRGDLTVEHLCWACGYVEQGPANPEAAKRRSPTVRSLAALLLKQRLGGVEIPLVYDNSPWPEEEW